MGSLPAGAADWLPEGRAVQIFAQIHECKERIEDARLHFVRQVQALVDARASISPCSAM